MTRRRRRNQFNSHREDPKRNTKLPAGPASKVHPKLKYANGGVLVEGTAWVRAHSFRRLVEALQIGARITERPGPYLATCAELKVEGVVDLRGLLPAPGNVAAPAGLIEAKRIPVADAAAACP